MIKKDYYREPMNFSGKISGRQGFTLIEMMIVLTMLAIVITVGAPSFGGFVKEGRLKSGAHALAVSFQTARLKSISANRRCYLDFAPGALTPADSFYTFWLDMDGDLSYDAGEIDSTNLALPDTKSGFRGFKLPKGVAFSNYAAATSTGPGGGAIPSGGVDFTNDQASFNSRGEGTAGSVYLLGENSSFYAITVSSLGAVRTWRWEDNTWK